MSQVPEYFSDDLTCERLRIVSEKLLDVLDEAENFAQSPNATPWFKGTANYGLPQGMLMAAMAEASCTLSQTLIYSFSSNQTLTPLMKGNSASLSPSFGMQD